MVHCIDLQKLCTGDSLCYGSPESDWHRKIAGKMQNERGDTYLGQQSANIRFRHIGYQLTYRFRRGDQALKSLVGTVVHLIAGQTGKEYGPKCTRAP